MTATLKEARTEVPKEIKVQDQVTFNTGILVVFGLIMTYMLFEAYKNKNGLKFGHEASLVCSMGLAISWFFLAEAESNKFTHMMKFNGELFFYFVMPPIVFAAGFNMYRKKFFENIANIMLFGVLGTLFAFFAYCGVTIWLVDYFGVEQKVYQKDTDTWIAEPVTLLISEILVMCALICSTDVIAAVAIINAKK
jgi:hypothetical protein